VKQNIKISSDGLNWLTTYINDVYTDYVGCICWSDNLEIFCALTSAYLVLQSSDGLNWISYPINNRSGRGADTIIYSEELSLFLATGIYGSGYGIQPDVIQSVDGKTWTIASNSNYDVFESLAYGNGIICAPGAFAYNYYGYSFVLVIIIITS
jgi:hypothetical protein